MIDQPTFADVEYESKKRKTRREIFLERMDGLIPWTRLEERIRPFYHREDAGALPTRCRRCCGFTACNCSTMRATLAWRTCYTRLSRCGGSWA